MNSRGGGGQFAGLPTALNSVSLGLDPANIESNAHMSERLETLKKARERMADDRDTFAKTLAAPFDRDKAERARLKFIETQALIDAIDRAIAGEQIGASAV
jgi:hypothetical protein